eukprot:6953122-Ditylum_brightwellii.AAC.1
MVEVAHLLWFRELTVVVLLGLDLMWLVVGWVVVWQMSLYEREEAMVMAGENSVQYIERIINATTEGSSTCRQT